MNEERLDKALEAMKNESAPAEELAAARRRVWERLALSAAACGEFQPKLRDYLQGRLADSRRLLMEDHLGRCPQCRRQLAELKGERKVVVMPPPRRAPAWPRWTAWALAAGLALVAIYLGRARIDTLLAPGGPRITVVAAAGQVQRLPEGALAVGAALGENEGLRTGPHSRARLRLADGSSVEVNERSELFVRAAFSGQTIHLERGDVIVQAARQRLGRLRVQTRDSLASVKGTVFAVSAGISGSVVSVIEGSVEVTQRGGRRLLKPGEQAASNPALQNVTVRDAVAWSSESEKYLTLLGDFAKLERRIAEIPATAPRTQARLVQYLPDGVVLYGAAPNLAGTIRESLVLAEQQAAESPAFRQWWDSREGRELKGFVDAAQALTPMLGEEIVFLLARVPGERAMIPVVVAEVQAGKRDALTKALQAVAAKDNKVLSWVTDRVMLVSDSPAHLQWAVLSAGRGASSAFAGELARRYQRGAGWLLATDVSSIDPGTAGPILAATGTGGIRYLFLEQRAAQGGEENEAVLVFRGPRAGLASWLAPGGVSGAAEYISSDAVLAVAACVREPRQLFDELVAQIAKVNANFPAELAKVEAKLGFSLADDIAASVGTDFAIAVERPSVPIPGWVSALAVYRPAALDASFRRLVDIFNAELKPEDQDKRLALEQETVNGRAFSTIKSSVAGLGFAWTYDRGYLLAGADRALLERAIATRGGGFPLIWSAAFQQQLPAAAGLHPSGFLWLNTGALESFIQLLPAGSLKNLLASRNPLLVVFNAEAEQIRAASRTRLSSLVLDSLLAGAAAGPAGKGRAQGRHDFARH